jgi:hypothetical protein
MDFQVLPRLFQYYEKFNLDRRPSDRAASAKVDNSCTCVMAIRWLYVALLRPGKNWRMPVKACYPR